MKIYHWQDYDKRKRAAARRELVSQIIDGIGVFITFALCIGLTLLVMAITE